MRRGLVQTVRNYRFFPEGGHQMMIQKIIAFTQLVTTPRVEQRFSLSDLFNYPILSKHFPINRSKE